jgi:hypothetical protein
LALVKALALSEMIIGIRALPFSAIAIFTGVAAMSAGANTNKAKVMLKDWKVFIFCFQM